MPGKSSFHGGRAFFTPLSIRKRKEETAKEGKRRKEGKRKDGKEGREGRREEDRVIRN